MSKPLLTALTGLTALTAFAGPAAAQAPPATAPLMEQVAQDVTVDFQTQIDSIDLNLDEPLIRIESDTIKVKTPQTKPKWGVQINSVNDFMPDAWTSFLGGPEHKTPDGSAFDDDGFTAEVQVLTNIQNGDEELVVGGRLMMVTQRGSRYPFAPDYEGLRTDVGEFVVQKNFRNEVNDKLTIDYGLGGGVQAVGDLGGEDLQRWFHRVGPAGGRVGGDLQGTQVRDGFRVMPMVTSGAKVTYEVNDNFDLIASGHANVPLGRGLGYAGIRAGVGKQVGDFNFEVGGKLDGAWTGASELDFNDTAGIREGVYGRIEYEPGEWGGVYTQLETGGFRDEPVLTFGIRIGFGSEARLNPFK